MFLTADQLAGLTGYQMPSAQIRWRRDQGLRHWVRADGRPAVSVASIDGPAPIPAHPQPTAQFCGDPQGGLAACPWAAAGRAISICLGGGVYLRARAYWRRRSSGTRRVSRCRTARIARRSSRSSSGTSPMRDSYSPGARRGAVNQPAERRSAGDCWPPHAQNAEHSGRI